MATDADIEHAWVKGWMQAYHDLWDIFARANAPEPLAPDAQRDPSMLEGIKMRLALMPKGYYHSVVGSGQNVMTGVSCDVPIDPGNSEYESVFICDVIPEYMVENDGAWERRNAMLAFIENAPTDIQWLIDALASSETQKTRMIQACKIGLGVIVRSNLKGKEPRDAIAALSSALAAFPLFERKE